MRMIDRPRPSRQGLASRSTARPTSELRWPLREVGALLEAKAIHPGRSARNHLRALARVQPDPATRASTRCSSSSGSPPSRPSAPAASRSAWASGSASPPRSSATPGVLLFDEPVNGLDPEGIQWVRELLRSLAKQGRTVFVSSHLMSEMALTADHVIVIGKGPPPRGRRHRRDDRQGRRRASSCARPDAARLAAALTRGGRRPCTPSDDGALIVTELDAAAIGELAASDGIVLHELSPQRASLEEAFMALTKDARRVRGGAVSVRRRDRRASGSSSAPCARRSTRSLATFVLCVGHRRARRRSPSGHTGRVGRASSEHLAFDPTRVSLSGLLLRGDRDRGDRRARHLLGVHLRARSARRCAAHAAPRSRCSLAKAVVLFVATLVVGEVCAFVSFFVGTGDPEGVRAVGDAVDARRAPRGAPGRALARAARAASRSGLGTMLRHTAGAITVYVALLLVIFLIVAALPTNWQHARLQVPPRGPHRVDAVAVGERLGVHTRSPPSSRRSCSPPTPSRSLLGGAVLLVRRDA